VFRITRKKVTFGETAAMEEEYKNISKKETKMGISSPRSSSFSFGVNRRSPEQRSFEFVNQHLKIRPAKPELKHYGDNIPLPADHSDERNGAH
jgi:hypothetical protein